MFPRTRAYVAGTPRLWLALLLLLWPITLCLVASCAQGLSAAEAPPIPAEEAVLVQTVLRDAVAELDWPEAVSIHADPPGQTYAIRATGPASEKTAISIDVAALSNDRTLLDGLMAEGLAAGVYHGRQAVIAHPGDPLADGRGVVAWRCGPYTLMAVDGSGTGRETELAEALYEAAERRALCGLPASLVILAQTADLPGGDAARPWGMAELAQRYYDANAYGRVELDLTLLDADGPAGIEDWFTVSDSIALYEGRAYDLAVEAVRRALAGLPGRPLSYVERVVLVVPTPAMMRLGSRSATTLSLPGGAPHVIELPEAGMRVEVADIVLIHEGIALGLWAHELGHTLYTAELSPDGLNRLTDRYDDGTGRAHFGEVGYWDLMGDGSSKGADHGMDPSHMSSYTKTAVGWLRLAPAQVGQSYALTALEHQRSGDPVLTADDPLSDDPRSYYLIEARDHDGTYGAPASGVVVYRVGYDAAEGHAVVDKLAESSAPDGFVSPIAASLRPTLHGVGDPDGRTRLELPGGLCIELVAEEQAPYRATVRVGAC